MTASLRDLKFAWDYFVRGRHRRNHRAEAPLSIEPDPLLGRLWFRHLLVADLREMFPHQGTWFADYDLRISPDQGDEQEQLLAFIALCEDFNRRIGEGQEHDFDEFDRFSTMSNCQSWRAELPNGCVVPMQGMIWFADGAVNWHHPEAESRAEASAYEFWRQNSPNCNSKAEQTHAVNRLRGH